MLHAVIMAGGSGTRFWPRSRRDRPKQLLRLAGERTMLQRTVDRIGPLVDRDRILVVTGADQAVATASQLGELPPHNIVAEPAPRDTAACVGLAAGLVASRDPEGVMVVMPADHVIEPTQAFHASIASAVAILAQDPAALVTFGVIPTRPETGYGYIEKGPPLTVGDGAIAHRVARFREKPDLETAQEFLATGRFLWNAGIFVWRAATILDEIKTHRPLLAQGLSEILATHGTPQFHETLERLFPNLERVPIDKAVLERSAKVAVIEAPYRWSDVGDWRALAAFLEVDPAGNAVQGNVVARDTKDSILVSEEGGLVAVLGVEGLVVIQAGGAVLVARKDQLDQLKPLVAGLSGAGFSAFL